MASVLTGFISFRETIRKGKRENKPDLVYQNSQQHHLWVAVHSGRLKSCTGSPYVPGSPTRSPDELIWGYAWLTQELIAYSGCLTHIFQSWLTFVLPSFNGEPVHDLSRVTDSVNDRMSFSYKRTEPFQNAIWISAPCWLCVFPSLTFFCLTALYMWLQTWRKPMADCGTWQRLGDVLWLT